MPMARCKQEALIQQKVYNRLTNGWPLEWASTTVPLHTECLIVDSLAKAAACLIQWNSRTVRQSLQDQCRLFRQCTTWFTFRKSPQNRRGLGERSRPSEKTTGHSANDDDIAILAIASSRSPARCHSFNACARVRYVHHKRRGASFEKCGTWYRRRLALANSGQGCRNDRRRNSQHWGSNESFAIMDFLFSTRCVGWKKKFVAVWQPCHGVPSLCKATTRRGGANCSCRRRLTKNVVPVFWPNWWREVCCRFISHNFANLSHLGVTKTHTDHISSIIPTKPRSVRES